MGWIDQRGSTVLTRNECLRLLALHAGGVGRVGVATSGAPLIVPVNYRMLGPDVLLQIGRGTMLDAVDRGYPLGFEVDRDVPPDAWSVYVRGRARRLEGVPGVAQAMAGGATAVVPQPGTALVVIRSDVVSGRQFPLPDDRMGEMTSRELGELALRPPVRLAADATIRDVAAAMEAEQAPAVVLGEHPMWLVSEHDLVGALAAGLEPGSAACQVATRVPLWATTTTTVEEAAALMARHCVEHLIVITADGALVGVLSRREALRHLVQERDQSPGRAVTSASAGLRV